MSKIAEAFNNKKPLFLLLHVVTQIWIPQRKS
ncbi:hypothetical protein CIY_15070 [Butyrivibrio fibrisolvens 16/4]|nr:hypothetical protein CIY_15070 [Butyrivibrio fibrisolvens 16/4]